MRRFGVILVLIPSLLEIINSRQFIIEIPGFPYTVGQLSFILIGLAGLRLVQLNSLGLLGKAFTFIYGGMLISSLLNGNIIDDSVKSIGIIFHFLAALGWSRLLFKRTYLYYLDILMLGLFFYWFYYILNASVLASEFVSYSKSYQEDRVINHHIPGINLSTASFYILIRFFSGEESFRKWGFVLLGTTILLMLILESRSNLIVCLVMAVISFSWHRKGKSFRLLRWIPLILLGYFVITFMTDRFSFIEERFALDSDYQEQTTIGRREVYIRFPLEFAQNPLGRGPNDYKIDLGRVTLNAHNNFLTQILIGGSLALLGVILFLIKQVRIGYNGKWFKNSIYHKYPPQIYAGYVASVTYFLTLLTIDMGNLLFYSCLASLLSAEYIFDFHINERSITDE